MNERGLLILAALLLTLAGTSRAGEPISIGSRRELFVDDHMIERLKDARRVLHHPTPREVSLVLDHPWEGNGCGFISTFKDGDRYRMYYKAYNLPVKGGKVVPRKGNFTCYAESKDGIHWTKPSLGLVSYKGSKNNNIVLADGPVPGGGKGLKIDAAHPAVFLDANPNAPADAKYKAIYLGNSPGKWGLVALKSADGLNWRAASPRPVITKSDHGFDSQNLAFWDPHTKQYRAYWRTKPGGFRDILTAVSKDFRKWSEPVALKYPGARREQLYTNVIKPYHRAPHILLGFPVRYTERKWSDSAYADLPDLKPRVVRKNTKERFGAALTDALLMSSRDGVTFHRWAEAFLRPGTQRPGTWAYGQNYLGWHVVETKSQLPGAANELSFYSTEDYWIGKSSTFRRYTLRLDGFASVQAGGRGGELLTKPLKFTGKHLSLNFSTSAAGSMRVEFQDVAGKPLPGFSIKDCVEIFGDELDRRVRWSGSKDLSALAGKTVRLRFLMRDVDLYSFRFGQAAQK